MEMGFHATGIEPKVWKRFPPTYLAWQMSGKVSECQMWLFLIHGCDVMVLEVGSCRGAPHLQARSHCMEAVRCKEVQDEWYTHWRSSSTLRDQGGLEVLCRVLPLQHLEQWVGDLLEVHLQDGSAERRWSQCSMEITRAEVGPLGFPAIVVGKRVMRVQRS